jgi:hypothetical protein
MLIGFQNAYSNRYMHSYINPIPNNNFQGKYKKKNNHDI